MVPHLNWPSHIVAIGHAAVGRFLCVFFLNFNFLNEAFFLNKAEIHDLIVDFGVKMGIPKHNQIASNRVINDLLIQHCWLVIENSQLSPSTIPTWPVVLQPIVTGLCCRFDACRHCERLRAVQCTAEVRLRHAHWGCGYEHGLGMGYQIYLAGLL